MIQLHNQKEREISDRFLGILVLDNRWSKMPDILKMKELVDSLEKTSDTIERMSDKLSTSMDPPNV